uniref:Uncharacterized protein n=1 Tax=Cacopsylla melanoneura TaxID=428564 RepID=A0A8D8Y9W8_9HEMI
MKEENEELENPPQPDPEDEDEEATKENVMLADLPELSKWERDDDMNTTGGNVTDETKLRNDKTTEHEIDKKVTSDIIKRAENAIFQKGIASGKSSKDKKKIEKDVKTEEPVDSKEKVKEVETGVSQEKDDKNALREEKERLREEKIKEEKIKEEMEREKERERRERGREK